MVAIRILAILILGLAISSCANSDGKSAAAFVDTFSSSGMLSGSVMKKKDCVQTDTSVWLPRNGHCIRYFHAGLKRGSSNAKAIFWFHGRRSSRFYPGNSPRERLALAESEYKQYGIPVIAVSRPGYYGSSGNRVNEPGRQYIETVFDAVAAIKSKYKIEKIFIGGSSFGARDVAALLTNRNDIECAVLASLGGMSEKWSFPKMFGPSAVPKHGTRRIILVGDSQDKIAPYDLQDAWFKSAKSAGHNVLMFTAEARGRRHHDLRSLGRSLIGECALGAPDNKLARIAKEFR